MPKHPRKSNTTPGPIPYNLRSGRGGNCNQNEKEECNQNGKEKGEWDEIKCPICLDPPHKAILLICSSHDKGCKPYVCDTSYLMSNCFDQFCDSQSVVRPAKRTSDGKRPTRFEFLVERGRHKLSCPLCRGVITGWIVDERARDSMNQIVRSCALDSCNICGDYIDLKDHARFLHDYENDDYEDDDFGDEE